MLLKILLYILLEFFSQTLFDKLMTTLVNCLETLDVSQSEKVGLRKWKTFSRKNKVRKS